MKTRLLHFAGSTIAIEYEGDGPDRVVNYLYKDILDTNLDEPHLSYRLVKDKDGALSLYRGIELERRAVSEEEMAAHLLDCIVYHLAYRSHGVLVINAAALALDGRGLLLPGPSGSG